MRGASTIREAEAAERLVLQTPELREWLIDRQLIRLYRHGKKVYARTQFAEAEDAAREILRNGDDALEVTGLSMTCWSVLGVAANLSGQVSSSLRGTVHDLDDDQAKLVGEAIMYAFGYMDASVEVNGEWGDEMGPNALDYERRLGEG
jgi:hypothetical protein